MKQLSRKELYAQRFIEILPGFMIWVLLLSPFWAGRAIPFVMADFLILLSIYWFYRALLTTMGVVIGYSRYRKAINEDWLEKCLSLSKYDLPEPETLPVSQLLPKHLLLYPQRVPQYEVLRTTLEGIRKQNYPLDLIYVAISFEERAIKKMEPGEAEKIQQQVRDEFPEFGDRLMMFIHPDGLKGEVIGAAANRTWGARNAVEKLQKQGEMINDFLITSPDEDVIFHPQFLAAATYKYLTSEKRQQKFYQTAVYTFNNNYWQVPILIRALSIGLTLPVLSSSVTEKHKRETYSCYTLSLDVLRKVGYWDVSLGIDDTTFYWRPFFYFKGDWVCEVFFVPLSADAVYDPSYIKNHRDQYKQYLRWGWGVIAFPIGFKGLLRVPGIPIWLRITKLWHLVEVFVFWKVLAYLLTVALPIVLFLNPQFNELVIWYSTPRTVSDIMSLSIIFILPATLYKILLVPPRPEKWSKIRFWLIILIEMPMNLLTLLTYSFLPFIEASTRMMIGQKSAKSVTWADKVR